MAAKSARSDSICCFLFLFIFNKIYKVLYFCNLIFKSNVFTTGVFFTGGDTLTIGLIGVNVIVGLVGLIGVDVIVGRIGFTTGFIIRTGVTGVDVIEGRIGLIGCLTTGVTIRIGVIGFLDFLLVLLV